MQRKLKAERAALLRAEKAGFELPAEQRPQTTKRKPKGTAAAKKPIAALEAVAKAAATIGAQPVLVPAVVADASAADDESFLEEEAAAVAASEAEDQPVGAGAVESEPETRRPSVQEPATPLVELFEKTQWAESPHSALHRSHGPVAEDKEIAELKMLFGESQKQPQPFIISEMY